MKIAPACFSFGSKACGSATDNSRCSGAMRLLITQASSRSATWINAPRFSSAVWMMSRRGICSSSLFTLCATRSINAVSWDNKMACASSSCSACENRSIAIQSGSVWPSQITRISEGPAIMSMPHAPNTRRLAEATGQSAEQLDFASVQRGNPEIERRCQEVIDRCWQMGSDNPIISIHDVGAGGLSNAMPELVNDAGRGARFELRAIPNDEPGVAPMEIWCNEAQERYVLAIAPQDLERFTALCERERCPYAVIGEATEEQRLVLGDGLFANTPIDMPLEVLLGKPPKMLREAHHKPFQKRDIDTARIDIRDALYRLLRLPTVASKSFLI